MDLLNQSPTHSLSVSDFLESAKQTISEHLPSCWIDGEITNFTAAASGHWYFVLRDARAQADCVMLKPHNQLLAAPPKDGDTVQALAQANMYIPRGRFQLMIKFLRPTGTGQLYQLFIERKTQWTARGWFNADNKKTPPAWPRRIGIVSSTKGAALHDVLRVIRSRMPSIDAIIYPALAQGNAAAQEIAQAIITANKRQEVDTLIICRGGGGIEDLWAYNEEAVVAAIVNSQLPIITGIGHEIDETLADLAADLSAPTPTGAAVLATPEQVALEKKLTDVTHRFWQAINRKISDAEQRLDWATNAIERPSILLYTKLTRWQNSTNEWHNAINAAYTNAQMRWQKIQIRAPQLSATCARLQHLITLLSAAAHRRLQSLESRQQLATAILQASNPQHLLAQGYSITRDTQGRIIKNSESVKPQDKINITLYRGKVRAIVSDE